jgi:hypothetical protein
MHPSVHTLPVYKFICKQRGAGGLVIRDLPASLRRWAIANKTLSLIDAKDVSDPDLAVESVSTGPAPHAQITELRNGLAKVVETIRESVNICHGQRLHGWEFLPPWLGSPKHRIINLVAFVSRIRSDPPIPMREVVAPSDLVDDLLLQVRGDLGLGVVEIRQVCTDPKKASAICLAGTSPSAKIGIMMSCSPAKRRSIACRMWKITRENSTNQRPRAR